MKFKPGDKIQYLGFMSKKRPKLAGIFVVDKVKDSMHSGSNLLSVPGLPISREWVCSEDFELAED